MNRQTFSVLSAAVFAIVFVAPQGLKLQLGIGAFALCVLFAAVEFIMNRLEAA